MLINVLYIYIQRNMRCVVYKYWYANILHDAMRDDDKNAFLFFSLRAYRI